MSGIGKEFLKYGIFILGIFFLIVFHAGRVDAGLGLTPALVEVNFQPGYNFSIDYVIIGADPDQKIEVYTKGDFSEYIHFNKQNITGNEGFSAYVNLPEKADMPGKNRLYVGVREAVGARGVLGTRIALEGMIAIYVPYPGKYAEVSLKTKDINEGEDIPITLEVNNLGKEDLFVSPVLDVFDYDGSRVDGLTLDSREVRSQSKELFETVINSTKYRSGVYNLSAVVDYGDGRALASSEFRVGTLSVNITNYTSYFTAGKINRFDIEIESLWNSKISTIYAAVNISRDGKSVDYFKTSPSTLEMWQKSVLSGYFNAENLGKGEYDANIQIYYEDRTSEKNVKINVSQNNTLLIFVVAGISAVVLINALILFLIWRKKNGKKKENKKTRNK